MSKRVAVVYLARIAEGMDQFVRFAKSYSKHGAGYDHDLIVLAKGLSKRGERAYIEEIFRGVAHKLIEVSDEGYDINAYLHVSTLIDHEYVLFFNTFTEILSPDWLAKLMSAASLDNVGVVGGTASYESITISQKFISKAIWLTINKKIPFESELYLAFKLYLDANCWSWVRRKRLHHQYLSGRILTERWAKPSDLLRFDDEFDMHWAGVTSDLHDAREFRNFPDFPNPHIRSNGFLIERRLLLKLNFELKPTKIDCNRFESADNGLSGRLLGLGRRLLLVGAGGEAYDVRDWPKSGTFRLENQGSLLFGDNQTRLFSALSAQEQKIMRLITWGDYVESSLPKRLRLGFSFAKNDRQLPSRPTTPGNGFSLNAGATAKLFSIVIPTHNKLALVADAIETVRRDTKHNWELVVFDNASEEALADHVRALADDRIRFFRSDLFLPVTDSWNRALAQARGDYVMVIGDDDGITPGFFEDVSRLIEDFNSPDCIYCSFYQFFHPGVVPWQREGYVIELRNAFFFAGRELPFLIDAEAKARAVTGSLRVRRNFAFNMQSLIFSRKLISRLTINGSFFHTPFPDYYIANMAFAMADTIVGHPRPLTIAGVSRKSFGYTLFNDLEEAGAKLLKTDLSAHESYDRCKGRLLPGPSYLTNYIVTMQHVRDLLPADSFPSIDFARYRRKQIASFIPKTSKGLDWLRGEPARKMWDILTMGEKFLALRLSFSKKKKRSKERQFFYARTVKELNDGGFSAPPSIKNVGDYISTLEIYEALEGGSLR